jgi:hypothetical protein
VELPPDVPVIISTLQNLLFLGPINDISSEIGDKLVVLIERQNTINPNMALRLLLYIAKMYEKTIKVRTVYGLKLIKLSRPEFWVTVPPRPRPSRPCGSPILFGRSCKYLATSRSNAFGRKVPCKTGLCGS